MILGDQRVILRDRRALGGRNWDCGRGYRRGDEDSETLDLVIGPSEGIGDSVWKKRSMYSLTNG